MMQLQLDINAHLDARSRSWRELRRSRMRQESQPRRTTNPVLGFRQGDSREVGQAAATPLPRQACH